MPSTPARELQISYDGLAMGAGTPYIIDGKVAINSTYGAGTIAFDLVVTGSDEAAFLAAVSNVEAEDQNPRGRVRVFYGSTSHIDWNPDPAINSGFNTAFSSAKTGSPHDTARSRRYRIEITAELPYTLSGSLGRGLTTTVNLTQTDAGRMRAFFQGTYRALNGNGARAQYTAQYNAWVAGILATFGGTWEGPFDINASGDDSDKNISFSQTWEELIFNQSVGFLDDPQLRRQRLNVTRLVEAPGDSIVGGQAVARLETVIVTYSVSVDRAQTQDLKKVYETKVLPLLIQTAKKVTNSGLVALQSQDPGYDFPENALNVTLTLLVAGNSNVIAATYRSDDAIDYGADIVKVWSKDKNRMKAHSFTGPGSITRTITQVWRSLKGGTGGGSVAGGKGKPSGGGGGGGIGIGSLGGGGLAAGGFDFGSASAGDFVLNPPNAGSGGGSAGGGDGLANNVDPSQVAYYPAPDGGTLVARLLGENFTQMPLVIGRAGDPQISVVDYIQVARYEFYVPADGGGDAPKGTTTNSGNHPPSAQTGSKDPNMPGTQS